MLERERNWHAKDRILFQVICGWGMWWRRLRIDSIKGNSFEDKYDWTFRLREGRRVEEGDKIDILKVIMDHSPRNEKGSI